MKFLKYVTAFAAAVGLTTACTTDIEMVQICPLDEAVAPVLHELPMTQIAINEETLGDKMTISWDKADFKAPVAIQYAVLASLGDTQVSLMTGITEPKADLTNSTLNRLTREIDKGGLAIAYEEPTTIQLIISAQVGSDYIIYSEPRDLELTITEVRDAVKMYGHSEAGWTKMFIYGWDLAGCNFGDWPGTEITANKETVNGKEYFYFEIPREAEGNTGNIIFNNGEGSQTQDITGVKMDKSRYFTIAAEADANGKYIATEELGPVKLYARSLAGWTKMFIYGWEVAGKSFEWPGEEITNTEFVNNVEWFVYELPQAASGTVGNIIFNNGDGQQTVDITSVAFTRDRFFEVSATADADGGKFSYTEIGGGDEPLPPTPPADDKLSDHTWGLIGDFNGWGADVALTVEGNFAVVKNVELAPGIREDNGAAFGFKLRADGGWDLNYGAPGDVEPFEVTIGEAVAGAKGGKNLTVPAAGTYDVYFDLTNANIWVMNAGDAPAGGDDSGDDEEALEPIEASEWGLVGNINNWAAPDIALYTTAVEGLLMAEDVELEAFSDFKFRTNGDWGTELTSEITGVKPNSWVAASSGSGNTSVSETGIYDIYLDVTNNRIYVMEPGKAVSKAVEQTESVAPATITWGLVGDHNNWGETPDIAMPAKGDYFVAENVSLEAGKGFKVRGNGDAGWNNAMNYGVHEGQGNIAVNGSVDVYTDGGSGNIIVPATGTYDVYFDLKGLKVWLMEPGKTPGN